MEDRYAGDIGDYVKLAMLRALSGGHRLGVAWWLVPNESHNSHGRFISYLDNPSGWGRLDPELFGALRSLVKGGVRNVSALERLGVLPNCAFSSQPIPMPERYSERASARQAWFEGVIADLQGCDLVFIDPDNGLQPNGFSPFTRQAQKCVTNHELKILADGGRTLVVYHHHTRRKGGHHAEIEHLADRLRGQGFDRVDALRAKPYSPRVFLILNGSDEIAEKAEALAKRWPTVFSWHPQAA
jgi:hypothetical protein